MCLSVCVCAMVRGCGRYAGATILFPRAVAGDVNRRSYLQQEKRACGLSGIFVGMVKFASRTSDVVI